MNKISVYTSLNDIPDSLRGGVVALGNFDGVHRGHQSVIGKAKILANQKSVPLIVLTFSVHPRLFFKPDSEPFVITPLANKIPHLQALGVDAVLSLDFASVQDMSADNFIDSIIVAGLGASVVSIGYDFQFGKNRTGNTEMLTNDNRFNTEITTAQTGAKGEVFSSTKVRNYIRDGQVGKATHLLGRPFEIQGVVKTGMQLGRTIGFPTANIEFGNDIVRPKYGVYAIRLGLTENDTVRWYDGVANYGNRPTVNGIGEVLESHIFDFDCDIYQQSVRLAFISFIRAEQKFNSVDDLKNAISYDCEVAKRIHALRSSGA